ncbi:TRAP-type C4-dicarboxylate transport system, substrate-binding protein [Lutimaribacter pacificus]|uniref:TRAP-type C4-dicarboxylate transport system, substrate-binding protein n=1 Tax=Lutimaribacter pacificus TaxID=391948 RepID=A0A1H0EMX3_9RHOB|nr:C4-dicarboxylate ABC transporter substrate-binding protein [Lutimaribacter pacificus]SDN83797.1 TRAP-type C4-dicarboxylate transport system, substrate-binding protein [Lutimaribacter pacificus]SHK51009.1 TRAP-type C4-dicarboxylate transport system, substrate-binding protein [Lutimaribacter pacificus]
MYNFLKTGLLAACAIVPAAASAQSLTVSASLPQVHFWVGKFMDPFVDAIEERTDITATRFYAGELTSVGRELDALQGGVVDVAVPLLAPYHEGAFPLSDVTQLPTIGTTSVTQTKAFLELMASDVELADGKTFYEYEIAPKNIHAWPVATTAAYAISFADVEPDGADALKGLPLRAGSALHTIFLDELGATPVTMPSSQSYEALSRGTINGTILSVGDWKSYSLQDVLTYTITGVAVGHWGSYLAISDEGWSKLSDEQKATWEETAHEIALQNAEAIEAQEGEVRSAAEADGSSFVDIADIAPSLQDAINAASVNTWKRWVEQTEADGHPGLATARLWADLTKAQGGELPEGVQAFLDEGM